MYYCRYYYYRFLYYYRYYYRFLYYYPEEILLETLLVLTGPFDIDIVEHCRGAMEAKYEREMEADRNAEAAQLAGFLANPIKLRMLVSKENQLCERRGHVPVKRTNRVRGEGIYL